ncbi:MAG: hypothetical protein ACFFA4_02430 [Promethearchaeota archaeon]
MTQTLKKEIFDTDNISDYYKKYYKSQNKFKPIVLNYVFRNISFITKKEKIRTITHSEYKEISICLNIPIMLIHKVISEYLINLLRFKKFLNKNPNLLHIKEQKHFINILIHRFYRLAPVFDYKRAKQNAKILQIKLNKLFFWPQLMTQLAIIIFVTDLFDKQNSQKIIQSNLRALCSCSAYAFHRTRNKLGLTSKFAKSLTA